MAMYESYTHGQRGNAAWDYNDACTFAGSSPTLAAMQQYAVWTVNTDIIFSSPEGNLKTDTFH